MKKKRKRKILFLLVTAIVFSLISLQCCEVKEEPKFDFPYDIDIIK